MPASRTKASSSTWSWVSPCCFWFTAVATGISAQGLTGFACQNMGLTGSWPFLLFLARDGAADVCAVLMARSAARNKSGSIAVGSSPLGVAPPVGEPHVRHAEVSAEGAGDDMVTGVVHWVAGVGDREVYRLVAQPAVTPVPLAQESDLRADLRRALLQFPVCLPAAGAALPAARLRAVVPGAAGANVNAEHGTAVPTDHCLPLLPPGGAIPALRAACSKTWGLHSLDLILIGLDTQEPG